ncbi:SAM-dependent methyltransferase [Clostridium estertheticum]|uniref:SAM-dependent methyltransferase n=1 Tax=Clostridium estertheticum TaxID=238834 RepID=UPI001C0B0786|nr:hypothetical protein [Clostridium estertheticum]MBU3187789.1 hypothetical protein [Clostridium estertheticum]
MLSLYKKYDEKFVFDNLMGPNSLKIVEEVSNHLELQRGMKILDLGCGKGLTSIFLAKGDIPFYRSDINQQIATIAVIAKKK